MNEDDLQAANYANELLQEEYEDECEHGIHRDSGHWCAECAVNRGYLDD